jgi:pilus assembly protein CpaE
MLCLIASDTQGIASEVRRALLERGGECPLANLVSIDSAAEAAARMEREPDVVFFAVNGDADRCLAAVEAMRRQTKAKLVAVGSADDPRLILRMVHAGAADFVDAEGNLASGLDELMNRLQSRANSAAAQGRLITILSPSGGAGCSFLAVNLAAALAKSAGRCVLCDFDLRQGDLASLLNLKPPHTIIDICRNLQRLDPQVFQQSLAEHACGVHLLAGPHTYDDVLQITETAAEKIVSMARASFPFVIVDLEDFFHREQFRVLQLSDIVFVVLRAEFVSVRNTRRTLDYLASVGVDAGKIRLVVNQFGRPNELSKAQAAGALQMEVAHYIPYDPNKVVQSINLGVPLVLEFPRAKPSHAICEIAGSLSRRVAERRAKSV